MLEGTVRELDMTARELEGNSKIISKDNKMPFRENIPCHMYLFTLL